MKPLRCSRDFDLLEKHRRMYNLNFHSSFIFITYPYPILYLLYLFHYLSLVLTFSQAQFNPHISPIISSQNPRYPVGKCDNINGVNYCGERGPGFTHMQCSGAEHDINECSWQIVHKKFMKVPPSPLLNLVIQCRGASGDPAGTAPKERPPVTQPAA